MTEGKEQGRERGERDPNHPQTTARRIKGREKGQGNHPQGKGKGNKGDTLGTPQTRGSHWQEREVKGEIK